MSSDSPKHREVDEHDASDDEDSSSHEDDELPESAMGAMGSWGPNMFGQQPSVHAEQVDMAVIEPCLYRPGPNGEMWPVAMPQPAFSSQPPPGGEMERIRALAKSSGTPKVLVQVNSEADPKKRDRREEKRFYRQRKMQYHTELSRKVEELEQMNHNLFSLKSELEQMKASKAAFPDRDPPGSMDGLITIATDMVQANQALPMSDILVAPNLSHSSPIFRTTWHEYVPGSKRGSGGSRSLQKQTQCSLGMVGAAHHDGEDSSE